MNKKLWLDHHVVLKKAIIIVANNPPLKSSRDAKRDNERSYHYRDIMRVFSDGKEPLLKIPSELHQIRGQLPEKIPSILRSEDSEKVSHFQHHREIMIIMDENWGQFSSIKSIAAEQQRGVLHFTTK